MEAIILDFIAYFGRDYYNYLILYNLIQLFDFDKYLDKSIFTKTDLQHLLDCVDEILIELDEANGKPEKREHQSVIRVWPGFIKFRLN